MESGIGFQKTAQMFIVPGQEMPETAVPMDKLLLICYSKEINM